PQGSCQLCEPAEQAVAGVDPGLRLVKEKGGFESRLFWSDAKLVIKEMGALKAPIFVSRPGLARCLAAYGGRGELPYVQPGGEVVGLALLIVETIREITLALEVVGELQGGPGDRHFVEVDHVGFRPPPEFVVTVVFLGQDNLPGILVQIEAALLVNVIDTFPYIGFHHPYPV